MGRYSPMEKERQVNKEGKGRELLLFRFVKTMEVVRAARSQWRQDGVMKGQEGVMPVTVPR